MVSYFDIIKYFDLTLENEKLIMKAKPNARSLSINEYIKYLDEIKKFEKELIFKIKNKNKKDEVVAVDIETTGLDPLKDKIRLISIYGNNVEIVTESIEEVRYILENPNILKVFHNAVFDVSFLKINGINVNNFGDTMIAAMVIKNTNSGKFSLKDLSKRYLNVKLDKTFQSAENWHGEITAEHKMYCLNDAKVTFNLHLILMEEIDRRMLNCVYYRETGTLDAVIELNLNAIKFNFKEWSIELDKIGRDAKRLENEIKEELNNKDMNLNSHIQLLRALQEKGIEINNTRDETLAKFGYDYEIVKKIRDYKKSMKLIKTFGENFKKYIGNDGKIRGDWRSIGTQTFRMTVKRPNLQGIPTAAKRYCLPDEGNSFVVADFSNIELRILAEMSQDQILIEAFKNGEDLHRKTASAIFNVSEDEINDMQRKVGKIINFGLIYGMTSYGLRQKLQKAGFNDITEKDAIAMRNAYFRKYPGVTNYLDKVLKDDVLFTKGGRYWLKDDKILPKGSKKRMNYGIQATASEGMKEALIRLMKNKKNTWKLKVAVHDEIVLEVPDEDVEEAKEFLKNVMIDGMEEIIKSIPIEVEVKAAKYWIK